MQARKTVQGKIVEKKIVCRTDEQIKLVQKLVKENCSSVRGFINDVHVGFSKSVWGEKAVWFIIFIQRFIETYKKLKVYQLPIL